MAVAQWLQLAAGRPGPEDFQGTMEEALDMIIGEPPQRDRHYELTPDGRGRVARNQ